MMPEILGIQIAVYHFAQKPANYEDFASHVEKVKRDQETDSKKAKSHGNLYFISFSYNGFVQLKEISQCALNVCSL